MSECKHKWAVTHTEHIICRICGMTIDEVSWLHLQIKDKDAEIASLRAEVERLKVVEKWFGEIMAVMHRDGGHYYCEHGAKKAANDAKQIYYDLRAEVDRLKQFMGKSSLAMLDEYGDMKKRAEQAEARVEKFVALVCKSAPVTWASASWIDDAKRWEEEAKELIDSIR